jgi:hypothetical protein
MSAATIMTRLPILATGDILHVVGGIPAWGHILQMEANGLTIGLAASAPEPDGNAVHIWDGAGEANTAEPDARLIVESSDSVETLIAVKGLDSARQGIVFQGGLNLSYEGGILYYQTNDSQADVMEFVTSGLASLHLSGGATPTLEGQGETTISTTGGALNLNPATMVGINETVNANMTTGLTINQGAADDLILALKSSDIAHGQTTLRGNIETDTYFAIQKTSPAVGGVDMFIYAEDNAGLGTVFSAIVSGGQATTVKTSASRSLAEFAITEHNGSNGVANTTADGNIFGIRTRVGGSDVTRWMVDEDGDTYQDGDLNFFGSATIKTGSSDLTLSPAVSVNIGGTANHGTTVGTNVLSIFNGTAPVGTLANGISLYSTAGECRVMDAAGNATLLSPHDSAGDWVFDSTDVTGKRLVIHMEKFMKALEAHFGWGFVEEFIEEIGG